MIATKPSRSNKKPFLLRKFVIAIILLLGLFFVISRFTEMQQMLTILKQGNWKYLGIALLLEICWIFNLGWLYKEIYRLLGFSKNSMLKMSSLATAANFLNTVAPSAGVSGLAIFLTDGQRNEYPAGKVTLAMMLFLIIEYLGLLGVVSLGIIVLIRRNTLNFPDLLAFIFLIIIAMILSTILLLSLKSPTKLKSVLVWFARIINKIAFPFFHKEIADPTHFIKFAFDISDGMKEMHSRPKRLVIPIALEFLSRLIQITILMLLFLNFNTPFSSGTIVAGFGIANLFVIVSPTPAGVGFVEGALTLTLTSLRVSLEAAAVITLGYRGVTFWFPFIIGLFNFRRISSHKGVS